MNGNSDMIFFCAVYTKILFLTTFHPLCVVSSSCVVYIVFLFMTCVFFQCVVWESGAAAHLTLVCSKHTHIISTLCHCDVVALYITTGNKFICSMSSWYFHIFFRIISYTYVVLHGVLLIRKKLLWKIRRLF